jgi:hypothetical protein
MQYNNFMVNPESNYPQGSFVSEEAMMGLKRAVENISRYGHFSRLNRPIFQKLAFTDGLLRPKTVGLSDGPSHLYSGPVIQNSNGRLYRIWTRLEGSTAEPVDINGQSLQISSAYSVVLDRDHNGEPSLFGNTITTADGKIFQTLAVPPFEGTDFINNSSNDPIAWTETYCLERDARILAKQYPDV